MSLIKVDAESGVFMIATSKSVASLPIKRYLKKLFIKDRPGFFGGVFGPINVYMDNNPALLDVVSRKMILAFELCESSHDTSSDLSQVLSDILEEILDHREGIMEFILGEGIFIPENSSSESWSVEEKTYGEVAYADICVLSTMLSPMIPCWGAYMHKIKTCIDSAYAPSFAVRLTNRSNICNDPAVLKIREYITAIDAGSNKSDHILRGVNSDMAIDTVIDKALVSRVASHDISLEAESNLISSVHQMVDPKKPVKSKFISDKPVKSYSDDGDDGGNFAESYTVCPTRTEGEKAEIRFAVSTKAMIVKALFTIDKPPASMVNRCVSETKHLIDKEISSTQEELLVWMFEGKVLPSKGLDIQSKKTIVMMMGVSKAFFEFYGMGYLSAIMSSEAFHGEGSFLVSGSTATSRMTKDTRSVLDGLFPYKETVNSVKKRVEINKAVAAIDGLVKKIRLEMHRPNADTVSAEHLSHGFVAMPRDIKSLLADLIIKIEG